MKVSYLKFTKLRKRQLITIGLLGLPLRVLATLVPKDRGLSIFGSYNGFRIGDNSYFEFLTRKDSKAFFITKNRALLGSSSYSNPRIVYAFSPKGVWLQLRARNVYFSHSIFDFFSPLVVSGYVTSLQHGYPIKNLGGLSKSNPWMKIKWLRRIFLWLFPHAYPHYCHRVFSPPGLFLTNTIRMYGFTTSEVVVKQYARIRATKPYSPQGRKILLALTFSKSVPLKSRLERLGLQRVSSISSVLDREELELVVRPHPIEIEQAKSLGSPPGVTFDFSENYQESLGSYLAVISDASSIAFDAIEVESPVFFMADELAAYELTENGIEENVLHGIMHLSTANLETAIGEILETVRSREKTRQRVDMAKRVFNLK